MPGFVGESSQAYGRAVDIFRFYDFQRTVVQFLPEAFWPRCSQHSSVLGSAWSPDIAAVVVGRPVDREMASRGLVARKEDLNLLGEWRRRKSKVVDVCCLGDGGIAPRSKGRWADSVR